MLLFMIENGSVDRSEFIGKFGFHIPQGTNRCFGNPTNLPSDSDLPTKQCTRNPSTDADWELCLQQHQLEEYLFSKYSQHFTR